MPDQTATGIAATLTAPILVGLIGSGIRGSASPALHMDEAQALGLRLRYDRFDLDDEAGGAAALPDLLDRAEQAGYAGLNITHPCKQLVIPYLHELSDEARELGAVNTVVFSGGRRSGHNTDWWGFVEGFRRGLPRAGLERVLQLGAGGAGSAVSYAMLRMGAGLLSVFDTEETKTTRLVGSLAAQFGAGRVERLGELPRSLSAYQGLINATPIGMQRYPGLPLPAALLQPSLWVAEIIYFPLETALLRTARALGCRAVDGGGMVVFQAAEAFRLFTGIQPDEQRMLQHFRRSVLE
jgi:shikimate dehydrogenase